MKILFNPTPAEIEGGTKSFYSWDRLERDGHLKRMFALDSDEKVVMLQLDEKGITATIEKVKETK